MCKPGLRPAEALAQEGLSSLEKSLLFQSQWFSKDEVDNHAVRRRPRHCELLSIMIGFSVNIQDLHVVLLLSWREETRQHIKQLLL